MPSTGTFHCCISFISLISTPFSIIRFSVSSALCWPHWASQRGVSELSHKVIILRYYLLRNSLSKVRDYLLLLHFFPPLPNSTFLRNNQKRRILSFSLNSKKSFLLSKIAIIFSLKNAYSLFLKKGIGVCTRPIHLHNACCDELDDITAQ